MRTCPYRLQLTAEDRRAVARWRRNIWIGYAAVAVILVLGSVVFAADGDDREGQSKVVPAQVDHFGVGELVKVLVPELDARPVNTVSGPPGAAPLPQAPERATDRDVQLRRAAGADSKPQR